ncbi:MAG: class I SAM-dependent methyltransferase [Hyphomicrobiaceae bacterium]
MSLFYRLAYRVGFAPWEHAAQHPAAAAQIAALFEREERERTRPFGHALDLGCGTGQWSVKLATRGWQVTGIDLVRSAIDQARQRAHAAGVNVAFVTGDVAALRACGIEPGFGLFWDFGTLHGLSQSARRAVGKELDALASPNATLLTLAWAPGWRGPLPRGASRADIEGAFANWRVIDDGAFDATGLPRPLRRVAPRFYRLRFGGHC